MRKFEVPKSEIRFIANTDRQFDFIPDKNRHIHQFGGSNLAKKDIKVNEKNFKRKANDAQPISKDDLLKLVERNIKEKI